MMSTEEDLNALLGINASDIIKQSNNQKRELAKISPDSDLKERIISETNDIMETTRSALVAVLDEVQTTPNDHDLVESASSLVRAQTGLIEALAKLQLSKERSENQITIAKISAKSMQEMNTENNQTKVLLSREEIMSRLMNDARRINTSEIIE